MAFVKIDGGIVVQKSCHDRSGFVAAPDDVVCGWLFDGANFAAPPVDVVALRRVEIAARLAVVDLDSIRALRAKVAGKGNAADDAKLSALDGEADTLRAELAALGV